MSGPAETAGTSHPAPEAEEPEVRDTEQEIASGRTAGTPPGVLFAVVVAIACLVFVALTLAAVAYFATDFFG
jgi:hypothetical protein